MYRVNSGESVPLIGKKLLVIGGGFTAMDVSRSAVRLGASEVHIVYRRTKKEIPVMEQEITEATEEGIIFHYLVSPLEVLSKDGKTVSGLKLIKNELGEPDDSGRRRPVPIKGSEYVMDCDVVAPAVSQAPSNECLNRVDDVELSKWGTIVVDEKTMMLNIEGLFACGDFTTGTARDQGHCRRSRGGCRHRHLSKRRTCRKGRSCRQIVLCHQKSFRLSQGT